MKKIGLCLMAFILCACGSIQENPVSTPTDTNKTEPASDNDSAEILMLPEAEYFMEDHGVMKVDDLPVSEKQKHSIVEWLCRLKLEPTHEYDEMFDADGKISTDYLDQAYVRTSVEYGNQRFCIISLTTDYGLYLLIFSDSNEKHLIDKQTYIESGVFVRDNYVDVSDLGVLYHPSFTIPKDTKISKQYLKENWVDIEIDLPYPHLGVWGSVTFSETEKDRNIEQLLFSFYAEKLGKGGMLKAVFGQLEPVYNGSDFNNLYEIEVDGEQIKLEYPVVGYSQFYKGEAVRDKFMELFGQSIGEIENTYGWSGYTYEPDADLYSYHEYQDGAIAGYSATIPYAYEISYSQDEICIKAAAIETNFTTGEELVNMRKNSSLPILQRHFSKASQADGVLTVSELIRDQNENLNLYEIHGKLNEWGTYSLLDSIDQTMLHLPEKDVIFYNNYEARDGIIVFAPLLDCSLASEINRRVISNIMYALEGNKDAYTFYEDDRYAVIYYSQHQGSPGDDMIMAYVLDKKEKAFNKELEPEQAAKYYEKLKVKNTHLSEDTPMIYFETSEGKFLYLKSTKTTQPALIHLNE